MNNSKYPPFTLRGVLAAGALSAAVWAGLTYFLTPFVPDERPWVIWPVAGLTAACLTGVFFLAVNMLMAVWRDQHHRGS